MMPINPAFDALADERFISLTTFRKSGVAVSTPVWIARDGNDLIVTTPGDSGKVKRLRNNARVELRPCSRMGKVTDDAAPVTGVAEIRSDDASIAKLSETFRKKYGLEYRIFMAIERRGKSGQKRRAMLRIISA